MLSLLLKIEGREHTWSVALACKNDLERESIVGEQREPLCARSLFS